MNKIKAKLIIEILILIILLIGIKNVSFAHGDNSEWTITLPLGSSVLYAPDVVNVNPDAGTYTIGCDADLAYMAQYYGEDFLNISPWDVINRYIPHSIVTNTCGSKPTWATSDTYVTMNYASASCIAHWYSLTYDNDIYIGWRNAITEVLDINFNGINTVTYYNSDGNSNTDQTGTDTLWGMLARAAWGSRIEYLGAWYSTPYDTLVPGLVYDIRNYHAINSYLKASLSGNPNVKGLDYATYYSDFLNYAKKQMEYTDDAIQKNSSDEDATVTVLDGITYIGPFKITHSGDIDSITITADNNSYTANEWYIKDNGVFKKYEGKDITNNIEFYIGVSANLSTSTSITVKFSAAEYQYYQARYMLLSNFNVNNISAQNLTIYYGREVTGSSGSVEFTVENNFATLQVQKKGSYAGTTENVDAFGFRLYYLNGSTKTYLRINSSGTITNPSNYGSITASSIEYTTSQSNATTIRTNSIGIAKIEQLAANMTYYIEEVGSTYYTTTITSATATGSSTSISYGNGVVSNITLTPNSTTTVSITDARATGSLTITKVDTDTNATLANVTFRIQNTDTSRYVQASGTTGTYTTSGYTTSSSSATIFTTNSSGKITISGLDQGNYKIIEVSNPNYGYTALASDVSVTVSSSSTATVKNEKQTGTLDILKKDYDDTSTNLQGVELKIKDSNGNYIKVNNSTSITGAVKVTSYTTSSTSSGGTTFITNSSGEIKLVDIATGTYTIEESSVGDNYGYKLDDSNIYWSTDGGTTKTNAATSSMKITVTKQSSSDTSGTSTTQYDQIIIYNQKQTGTLELVKTDLDSGVKLEGVEFKITASNGEYIRINDTSTVTGRVYISGMTTTTDVSKGTTFVTDSNGEIKLVNILVDTYTIQEISVGDNEGYEADEDSIWWSDDGGDTKYLVSEKAIGITVERELSTNTTSSQLGTTEYTELLVYNQKKYIKISGYVWKDMPGGKDSAFDNIYIQGDANNKYTDTDGMEYDANDVLMQGITVRLKDTQENVISTTVTGEDGTYLFDKVLIDELDNYYIEFEYDGEIYTTVRSFDELGYSNATAPSNTSKAREVESEREDLDNSYTDVTGMETPSDSRNSDNSESYGYIDTDGTSGNQMLGLTYDSTTSADEDAKSVYNADKSDNYDTNKLTANTQITEYNALGAETIDSIRENGITELENRNCGLREREQVELSISVDIVNVVAKINGYTNTYIYGAKKNYEDDDEFRLAVKTTRFTGYTKEIYASDIVYTGENTTQIFVTYEVKVTNNSTTLVAEINEIANYYDARYTVESYGSTEELMQDITLSSTNKYGEAETDTSNSYDVVYAQNLGTIEHSESLSIYIQYKLSDDAVESVLSGDIQLYGVSEINGYATYYGEDTYHSTETAEKEGELYASIDRGSAPGNLVLGDRTTYEKDTAIAPAVTMTLTSGGRTVTGTVFEDSQTAGSAVINERLGDGIYDDGTEGNVEGVTVEALVYEEGVPKEDLEVAKVYKYESGTKIEEEAVDVTDANGEYEISGLIPDEYILRFTYEDGNTIYTTTGETEEIKANDYKATIITSDIIAEALDNNTIVGDGSTADGVVTTTDGTIYDNNKWYLIDEGIRYSDAMDSKEVIEASQTESKPINNSNYDNNSTTSKDAFTGAMNVQIEYEVNETSGSETDTTSNTYTVTNPDGTVYVEEYRDTVSQNVDFGIIEVAKKSIELEKEVSNIKITLTSGQVLINGDPRMIDVGGTLTDANIPYVRYVYDATKRAATVFVEMDDEILYGATLELEYEIIATNNSEINYLTDDYYKYGTDKTNIETVTITKIIDYLDNDLIVESIGSGNIQALQIATNGLTEVNGETIDLHDYLATSVYLSSQEYTTILMLTSDKEIEPVSANASDLDNSDSTETWQYVVNRIMTSIDDLTYENIIEIIEIDTTNTVPKDTEPGNYDPNPNDDTTVIQLDEPDNYEMTVTITNPTGEDRSTTYYIIGVVALTVLAIGVVIIKKKVL